VEAEQMIEMTTLKTIFAATLLVVSMAGPVASEPAEVLAGIQAHDRRDYKTALRLYESAADQGDAMAAWFLGLMYDKGEGVLPNGSEAAKWYRLAIERGLDTARVYLGELYYKGRGVPQDFAEALKWFRPAADMGDVSAQYYLGLMFYEGQEAPKDYVQAYKWLNLSAANEIVFSKDDPDHDDVVQKRGGF
jgi:TPR repeat protein